MPCQQPKSPGWRLLEKRIKIRNYKNLICLETRGIDPGSPRMLSERSTTKSTSKKSVDWKFFCIMQSNAFS